MSEAICCLQTCSRHGNTQSFISVCANEEVIREEERQVQKMRQYMFLS